MKGMHQEVKNISGHISGMLEQYKISSNAQYEYSEPMCIGGPQGTYRLRSPYTPTTGVQWKVDTVSDGGTAGTFLVSNEVHQSVPSILVSDSPTTELSPIKGLLGYMAGNGIPPIHSSWYDLTDSSGILYIYIKTAAAMYLNIQFRHKR